jgi:hypothetical protein
MALNDYLKILGSDDFSFFNLKRAGRSATKIILKQLQSVLNLLRIQTRPTKSHTLSRIIDDYSIWSKIFPLCFKRELYLFYNLNFSNFIIA